MDLRAYTDQFIAAFQEDARALGLEEVEEIAARDRRGEPPGDGATSSPRSIDAGTPIGATGRSTSRSRRCPSTASWRASITRACKPGARVDADNYAKEDARDFVLWKAAKPGEPTWDLVDPPGRPGWHLECSAMALRLLGEPPIDIHAGGIDLIFPHHENEIAQSEGATGKPFSRFWMHVEHLLVDDQKMSKSLGNTLHDVRTRGRAGYRPSAVRYLLLSAHYRKQLNFTWASLTQTEESLRRLTDFLVAARRGDGRRRSRRRSRSGWRQARRPSSPTRCAATSTRPARSRAMFDLVRALNSAIDAGALGHRRCGGGQGGVRRLRSGARRFCRCRRAEDAAPPVPVDGDRAAHRRASRRAAAPRLRGGRPHSRRSSLDARHPARGLGRRDALEAEVGRRETCQHRDPRSS